MPQQPEISIIVLSLNRPKLLRYCLESVFRHTLAPFELIIWDNGSDMPEVHDYLNYLAKQYPSAVRLLKSEKNVGCGIGRAYALEQASGRILCTLDSDMNVTAGWDTTLLTRLKESDDIAAVSAKIVNSDNRIYGNGGICREIGAGFAVLENLDVGLPLTAPGSPPQDCHWLPAGAMMLKREAYLQHPYSKRRYFNGLVEINVCFKLRKAGWRLVNCPTAVTYHFPNHLEAAQKDKYYSIRSSRSVFCQSTLYFEDDFSLNTVMSWGNHKKYIGMDNPTLLHLHNFFSEMRKYIADNNGISVEQDGVRLYNHNIIENYLMRLKKNM